MRAPRKWIGIAVISALAFPASLAKDYYVSPAGDDAGPGSWEKPWKTLDRIRTGRFEPGDRIFLEGGSVFRGTLFLGRAHSGTASQRVLLSSYGSGVPVIDGGDGRAVDLEACSYLSIRNLKLVGSGRKTGNEESGLRATGCRDIELDNLEVTGFRKAGVKLEDVQGARVTRVHAHANGFAGIASSGGRSKDVYVGYCLAENNPGDPGIPDNHSGNGIVLGDVEGAVIEYCEARYNGWDMPRKGNGPVGIWAYRGDRVIIQHNVSHHNRSTGVDGGGFDFDGGVTNSVLQYNYSHNNHGAGYLLCQYRGAPPFRNNSVRYNISQDDGLTNHNAGIHVYVGGEGMGPSDVYHNTIYNSKGAAVSFGYSRDLADQIPVTRFRNNIFVSGEAQIEGGSEKGEFQGNLYWAMGDGGFQVDGYESLEEWARATGQETVDGRLVGLYSDPKLWKDGPGLLTDPSRLHELHEYRLLPGSPAIGRALPLGRVGVDPAQIDFFGTPLPPESLTIGAFEYGGIGRGLEK